ncbi:Sqt1 protein [Martiniozyma asiatica (nom. inval.)]|nr:Sqt1 protein [Martiniozyma asiatica]
MSEHPVENIEEEERDVIINDDEVAEVVDDDQLDQDEPMDEDDEDDQFNPEDAGFNINADGNIEIDMSNNSQSYFEDHTDSIFTVCTHPTLPIAMSGGGDNVAYLWTTHKSPSQTITKLAGYGESVIASSFTFDGSYLVTADMSGKVIIYKSSNKGQSWIPYDRILEDVEEVSWIKVHPKQNVFAFGGLDGSVLVYQIEPTLDMIFAGYSHSIDCTNGLFYDINNMDSLKLVSISEDGSIIGWNCYTQQQEFKFDSSQLKGLTPPWVSIEISPNGKIACIGSRDSLVAIINLENGSLLSTFTAYELKENDNIYNASIESISWCDSLPLVAMGLVSGDIYIFDVNTWKIRRSLKCQDAITKVQFIKGKPFLLASSMDGKVYQWDARTGDELHKCVGHHMGVLDFAIDCSGERLVTAGDDGVSLVYKF